MAAKKKLQVFISSTYQDLRDERQAAVEAILTAGHIPAGMELFAAGDESQMNVIKRWISESDVFLLILGGRYGSIEPLSGLSYIHLEFREAIALGKPVFAVVMDESILQKRVKKYGTVVVETENAAQLREFRKEVMSRLVKFWSDPRDIKLAIHETMAEFGRRSDLVGWIPGDQNVDAAPLAEELARLTRENSELRMQLQNSTPRTQTYNGLTFDELVQQLRSIRLWAVPTKDRADRGFIEAVSAVSRHEGGQQFTALVGLWALREQILPNITIPRAAHNQHNLLKRLEFFGILSFTPNGEHGLQFQATSDGREFILRLIVDGLALPDLRQSTR